MKQVLPCYTISVKCTTVFRRQTAFTILINKMTDREWVLDVGAHCQAAQPALALGPNRELWGRTTEQFTEHEKNRPNILSPRHRFPGFGALGIGLPLASLSNLFSFTCVVLTTYFWASMLLHFEILQMESHFLAFVSISLHLGPLTDFLHLLRHRDSRGPVGE